jgi:hypothetical protein
MTATRIVPCIAALLAVALAGVAEAGVATGTLGVQATVLEVCLIHAGGARLKEPGPARGTQAPVALKCTPGGSYQVSTSPASSQSGAATASVDYVTTVSY